MAANARAFVELQRTLGCCHTSDSGAVTRRVRARVVRQVLQRRAVMLGALAARVVRGRRNAARAIHGLRGGAEKCRAVESRATRDLGAFAAIVWWRGSALASARGGVFREQRGRVFARDGRRGL